MGKNYDKNKKQKTKAKEARKKVWKTKASEYRSKKDKLMKEHTKLCKKLKAFIDEAAKLNGSVNRDRRSPKPCTHCTKTDSKNKKQTRKKCKDASKQCKPCGGTGVDRAAEKHILDYIGVPMEADHYAGIFNEGDKIEAAFEESPISSGHCSDCTDPLARSKDVNGEERCRICEAVWISWGNHCSENRDHYCAQNCKDANDNGAKCEWVKVWHAGEVKSV